MSFNPVNSLNVNLVKSILLSSPYENIFENSNDNSFQFNFSSTDCIVSFNSDNNNVCTSFGNFLISLLNVFVIISGVFINKENLDPLITDLLIVGDDVDRRKLRAFLRATEAEVGKEIKFTVMDKEEFQYRLAMFDRFIRVLLESPHEKLINRLGI